MFRSLIKKSQIDFPVSDYFSKRMWENVIDEIKCKLVKDDENYLIVQMPGFTRENIEVVFDESNKHLSITAKQKHDITGEEIQFQYSKTLLGKCVKDITLVNGELVIKLDPVEAKTQTKIKIN